MVVHYADDSITLHLGDALAVLRELPDASVNCVVTSPPYFGLRDYGVPGQYGLEATPAAYVATMAAVFAEVRRVLAADGTLWLNLGDSYAGRWSSVRSEGGGRGARTDARTRTGANASGLAEKNLLGIPWRVAFALQDEGWILRSEIIWNKTNAMPEPVTDRLSTRHETVFLFSRSPRYWFDLDPIREPLAWPEALTEGIVFGGKNGGQGKVGGSGRRSGGSRSVYGAKYAGPVGGQSEQTNLVATGSRHYNGHSKGRNPGDVWTFPTQPFPDAHFAVMPPMLAEQCVLAGCKPGGTVLDPFAGSCTTGMVATKHGRRFVGIDLSEEYLRLALRTRLAQGVLTETAS